MAYKALIAPPRHDNMKVDPMAKLGKTPKQCIDNDNYSQGIGYYIPDTMSHDQWRQMKQKWDQQLHDSGFTDIEYHSSALDGHFFPTLRNNSIEKNTKAQTGAIPAGIEGYYDYCSTFYELADWKNLFNNKRFKRQWSLMRELFRLHKDGVSYGDMRQALRGRQTSYMIRFNIAPCHEQHRQQRSKYWLFEQISRILSVAWLWHATNSQGSLTPYDLEHMQVTGLTPEVIAMAKKLGKASVVD